MASASCIVAQPALAASDAAVKFGARDSIESISLSPDGTMISMIQPGPGRSALLYVVNLVGTPQMKPILASKGDPERLMWCAWPSNTRLICNFFVIEKVSGKPMPYTRLVTLKPDGSDMKPLSARGTSNSLGIALGGGGIVDWLGDDSGAVLMSRNFVPEQTVGTIMASSKQGYGVERVDTTSLARKTVEQPKNSAFSYISDGHGVVRVMGIQPETSTGYDGKRLVYTYRKKGSRDWLPLGTSEITSSGTTGFTPYAVDPDLDVVYGAANETGRTAIYKIALDGSLKRELVYERPDVDVDQLVQIGRQHRVVGISYSDEKPRTAFFDPALNALSASLSKALPGKPLISFVDASADEKKLLLWAGSDSDPGRFYLFDKKTKGLTEIMAVRPQLAKTPLAEMKTVKFPAADGTMIPAYLTLPPGSDGKNLPAIVMPHGGPEARDEWAFSWLPQFFANRGYAVLQPNYRGSTGYGDAWMKENAIRSWKTAIGDVDDGGRWLLKKGIAAADKIAIVGWSYGGYAALQSGVLDPGLFKAIAAVAPVTDFTVMLERSKDYSAYKLTQLRFGSGPHLVQGSPARNADRIKVPVLMFHGDLDLNVPIEQSRLMESRLKNAGANVQLVEYDGLDHQLVDDKVRAEMLDKIDAFLRTSMNLGKGPD